MPVDGGSARDLRAAAITADSARQLTGLCATAHRPDARAQAPRRGSFFFLQRKKNNNPTGACAQALAMKVGPRRRTRSLAPVSVAPILDQGDMNCILRLADVIGRIHLSLKISAVSID